MNRTTLLTIMRWPLRSRPRFLATAVLALVLLITVTRAATPRDSTAAAVTSATTSVTSATTSEGAPASPVMSTARASRPTSQDDRKAAEAVATQFLTRWLAKTTNPQWHNNLRSLTDPEFWIVLGSTSPKTITATRITAPGQAAVFLDGRADVVIRTDTGNVQVTTIFDGIGWVASDVKALT